MLRTLQVWESIEHHHAFINNKERYSALRESLDKGVEKFDFLYHVTLAPNDPYPALEAPLTELAIWKMREGIDRTKFTDIFTPLMAKGIERLPIQTGGWGASAEDDEQFTVILGWESLEVRELATVMLRIFVNSACFGT